MCLCVNLAVGRRRDEGELSGIGWVVLPTALVPSRQKFSQATPIHHTSAPLCVVPPPSLLPSPLFSLTLSPSTPSPPSIPPQPPLHFSFPLRSLVSSLPPFSFLHSSLSLLPPWLCRSHRSFPLSLYFYRHPLLLPMFIFFLAPFPFLSSSPLVHFFVYISPVVTYSRSSIFRSSLLCLSSFLYLYLSSHICFLYCHSFVSLTA